MFFELRTYDLKPGKAPVYLEFFRTFGVGLVTRHLPMGGYWMVESGTLNRIEHLWIYEDFEERDSCRASLVKDREWMEDFIPKAFQDIVAQQNRIMRLTRSSDAFDAVIENRRDTHDNQAAETPMFASGLQGMTFSDASEVNGEVLAQFRVATGHAPGNYVTLCAGSTVDLLAGTENAACHELLRPLTLSPLR